MSLKRSAQRLALIVVGAAIAIALVLYQADRISKHEDDAHPRPATQEIPFK